MSVSYRLSHLVFVNSLVRSVGELGVRAQFRDNKMAVKVEQSLSEKYSIQNLKLKLPLVAGKGLTSWCRTTWSSPQQGQWHCPWPWRSRCQTQSLLQSMSSALGQRRAWRCVLTQITINRFQDVLAQTSHKRQFGAHNNRESTH